MHERKTPSGTRRLVILRRKPGPQRQSWDLPLTYSVTLVDPATVNSTPSAYAQQLVEVIPREYVPATPAPPADYLRFFAGQPDGSDPSRFTVRYRRGDRTGTLHGRLEDSPPYDPSVQREPVLRLEAEEDEPH